MNDKQLLNFYDVLGCLAMVALTTLMVVALATLMVLALTHAKEVSPANIDCTVKIKSATHTAYIIVTTTEESDCMATYCCGNGKCEVGGINKIK